MAEQTDRIERDLAVGDADAEALGDESGDELVHRLIADEFGDTTAEIMRRYRRSTEAWYRREHPNEGLRERKRRLTRQLISDAATSMFATRGFDNVKVSEVADRVGVSEKTVYNYFPTKESLVLDTADEALERLARTLRERRPGESLTEAVVEAINADTALLDEAPDEVVQFLPAFAEMIFGTPALRAAWLELHDRLAKVARDELAAQAEVDPGDPEPIVAGRALAGLAELAFESRVRHLGDGLRGQALRDAVTVDLERGARLLETGLWSFNLLARGTKAKKQAIEAAQAADEARAQVVKALRQARAAWTQVRQQGRAAAREARAADRRHPRR
ncbi:MAG TPA: TetR family transcriptional regulator [Solirubrobacteraceae bacterium]